MVNVETKRKLQPLIANTIHNKTQYTIDTVTTCYFSSQSKSDQHRKKNAHSYSIIFYLDILHYTAWSNENHTLCY